MACGSCLRPRGRARDRGRRTRRGRWPPGCALARARPPRAPARARRSPAARRAAARPPRRRRPARPGRAGPRAPRRRSTPGRPTCEPARATSTGVCDRCAHAPTDDGVDARCGRRRRARLARCSTVTGRGSAVSVPVSVTTALRTGPGRRPGPPSRIARCAAAEQQQRRHRETSARRADAARPRGPPDRRHDEQHGDGERQAEPTHDRGQVDDQSGEGRRRAKRRPRARAGAGRVAARSWSRRLGAQPAPRAHRARPSRLAAPARAFTRPRPVTATPADAAGRAACRRCRSPHPARRPT